METPTKPGFYWAQWVKAEPDTFEGNELTLPEGWAVVEVWENHIGTPCEADEEHGIEKYLVFVGGVRESQPLRNFQWGPEVKKPSKT